MKNTAPEAWSRTIVLSGHPQLTPHLRGEFVQVWIRWPLMGVSFLHSMQKVERPQ